MKIFLTGATGFFGSRLAGYLLEHTGHSLVCLARKGRSAALPASDRLTAAEGDVTEPAALARAMAGCEAVIHSAAMVATWARDRTVFDRVNVGGTLNVLRAAGELGLKKIIYTSSFMALGTSDGWPLDEQGPHEREVHFNDYERTKYLANLEACELAEKERLPLVVLYPTVMYGPGPLTAGNLVVSLLIDYLAGRMPARLGDGSPRWNYVFVEDVARGHVLALEKARPGERFILGGENVSMAEFFETVERVCGVRQPRLAVPFALARLAGAAEELLARLTGRVPQTTRAVIDIFRRNWIYDSGLAARRLGYCPLSLEEGLARTVEWIRTEGLDNRAKKELSGA